jgi:hypothetical protein
MEPFVHTLEVWIGYVRVNLSGGNIAMTKHSLYAAQIGTVHKKIGSK